MKAQTGIANDNNSQSLGLVVTSSTGGKEIIDNSDRQQKDQFSAFWNGLTVKQKVMMATLYEAQTRASQGGFWVGSCDESINFITGIDSVEACDMWNHPTYSKFFGRFYESIFLNPDRECCSVKDDFARYCCILEFHIVFN